MLTNVPQSLAESMVLMVLPAYGSRFQLQGLLSKFSGGLVANSYFGMVGDVPLKVKTNSVKTRVNLRMALLNICLFTIQVSICLQPCDTRKQLVWTVE
jgi:hypothetical protein